MTPSLVPTLLHLELEGLLRSWPELLPPERGLPVLRLADKRGLSVRRPGFNKNTVLQPMSSGWISFTWRAKDPDLCDFNNHDDKESCTLPSWAY